MRRGVVSTVLLTGFFLLLSISVGTSVTRDPMIKAGTVTGDSGSWVEITYPSFSSPVVVGTVENTGDGNNGLVFEAKSVTSTSAMIRVCDSDGVGNCEASTGFPLHYLVVDADAVNPYVGIEAGTFQISGEFTGTSNTVSYSESFDNMPIPLTSTQTVNGVPTIETRVSNADVSSFTAGLCQQDSSDACNGGHTTETVGWVAIQPDFSNLSFVEAGHTGNVVSSSNWDSESFDNSFSETPVGIVSGITEDGGQEAQIDEVRNLGTGSMDVRYCEMQSGDTCDGHTDEDLGWVAIKPGERSLEQVCTGDLSSRCDMCNVDDVDVTLRAPDDSTTQEYTGFTHSSESGTCGTDPEVTETWTRSGYDFCPQEGNYDAYMEAYAQGDSYEWETSSWFSSIYSVNYDSSSDWCGCGDQYAGNTYNWLASATDYNDAGYPRCCGDEGSEIWEAAGGGNSACVNGETVSSGGVASNDRSYLTKDGELHWCKVPGGASKPYSWLTEWYECDYVSTSSGEYYCGAGGTDKEGKWYTLQNSGCQLVERIRGGRIIVH